MTRLRVVPCATGSDDTLKTEDLTMPSKTQTSHTAGPWHISKDEFGIFVMSMKGGIAHLEERDDRKANARLIASAPELLQSLITLVKMTEDDDLTTEEINVAKRLIARAEGRPA